MEPGTHGHKEAGPSPSADDPSTFDDPLRRDLVARARRFRSSWVEMAEGLIEVRQQRAYERWGYKDLYAYCAKELRIRKTTVDKLTGSYVCLERHAPDTLKSDAAPACDAVDYFAKALGFSEKGPRQRDDPPSSDVVEELRQAVFDEGQGVAALRRRFDSVIRPQAELEKEAELLEKASSMAARLMSMLEQLSQVTDARRTRVERALRELQAELDEHIRTARERISN